MATVSLEGMTPEAIAELAVAAKGMLDNPQTRVRALALVKENTPNVSIPELDLPMQFHQALNAERQKREELENKLAEREVREEIERQRRAILSKGIRPEEVSAVEKLMTDKSIGSHDTAADFYLAQNRLATPTAPDVASRFHSQQLPVIDAKEFGGSVKSWAKAEAMRTLGEIRSGNFSG